MNVKWLIERDGFWHGQPNRFSPALEKLKIEHKLVRFIADGDYPNYYDENDLVIVKGSLEFLKQIENLKRYRIAFWNGVDSFKCSKYYAYYGEYLLNGYDYLFLPLSEVKRRLQDLLVRYNCTKFFIRPDSGAKEFTGHVTEEMERVIFTGSDLLKEQNIKRFDDKLKKYSYNDLSPEELVMVTSFKKIDEEYRFFIIDRKVVAGSTYMINSAYDEKETYPQEAFDLADKIAKIEWRPSEAFVVDVCRTNDLYKVLEINSFNCSDIYSCNPEIIVKKVNDFIEKK